MKVTDLLWEIVKCRDWIREAEEKQDFTEMAIAVNHLIDRLERLESYLPEDAYEILRDKAERMRQVADEEDRYYNYKWEANDIAFCTFKYVRV